MMRKKLLVAAALMATTFCLTACGNKKTTIIDEITLNMTTLDEVSAIWDEKNLVYTGTNWLYNTVADEFLGYDSYYSVRDRNEDNVVDYVSVTIGFHNDDEVKQANSDITAYLEKKSIKAYDQGVKYKEVEDNAGYRCVYPIDTINKEGAVSYVCVDLAKYCANSEDEMPEGYSKNYFVLSYFEMNEENFIRYYVEGGSESDAVEEASTEDADAEEEDTEAVESAEEETAEEAETTDDAVADEASTATDSSTLSESEKEKIFSKFLGFWVWENEVKEYQAGGGYNGIDIADRAGAAYMEDGARYEFQVTRGERWTDAALVSCSEKELVFEYADYYGSTKRVTLTLLDENTIEETFESESGSSTQKAVKSTSLGEPENIDENVEQIRTWYYDTQERLDSLLYASYDTNLECYFDGAYPAKVVAKSGYNNWNVTREYYYHDQKLYFVFVHGDIGEYRFYIKDGVIIRSIDAEGISVDAGYGASPEIWDISDKFFEEEEAFPLMINCGN